jgi:hypothetical protein
LIVAQVGGIFLIFNYPVTLNFDGLNASSYFYAALGVIQTAVGILLLIPFIGWWLTRNDLAFVAASIERNLQLQAVPKSTEGWLVGV